MKERRKIKDPMNSWDTDRSEQMQSRIKEMFVAILKTFNRVLRIKSLKIKIKPVRLKPLS